MRSDCSVAEVLDAYLVAYLKRMEKSGWPEGAVSLEALRSHLLRVLPEIWRLRDEGLSAEEIAVVDEYVIDYQILMSNNGLPMLPFCVAVADMWMEESR
jgi:hypothetical protein